jgi:hypothetical protein
VTGAVNHAAFTRYASLRIRGVLATVSSRIFIGVEDNAGNLRCVEEPPSLVDVAQSPYLNDFGRRACREPLYNFLTLPPEVGIVSLCHRPLA